MRKLLVMLALLGATASATVPDQGESPRLPMPNDNFTLRQEMIPMRDGVRLRTFILIPHKVSKPLPMLLLRTPYDAVTRLGSLQRTDIGAMLGPRYAELDGYLYVFQDIRGRNGSEGQFQFFRPLRGPFNGTQTDETTDGWDTVEWLVKHVEESSGRVGLMGTSYEGWLVLTCLLDPHPAVRAAIPVNPMVDIWLGDDAFHNGAFRAGFMLDYLYGLESRPDKRALLPRDHYDQYTWWLRQGSPRWIRETFMPQAAFFSQLIERPAYDSFWQDAALDRRLARSEARLVPTLHVHGFFDQEDSYGAPAAYAALEMRDENNDKNFFTAGPWYHGESWAKGAQLGSVDWSESTAARWRRDVLARFMGHYLKGEPAPDLANAMVFNTGIDRWERFDTWPAPTGTDIRRLYLQPGRSLSWARPNALKSPNDRDAYQSDPANPVPYQPRPIRSDGDDTGHADWRRWLASDQRFVDGRPDVLSFTSEPLAESITVRGEVTARLFAETTGSDADWIVKVIDVFPDQDPFEPEMSGYELMISAEILRGRYRESLSEPRAITANRPLEYTIRLPQVNHTFARGHRLMVQIQSSWFPLYDRNPQRFIPSIMDVRPEDYQVATHTVHHSPKFPSHIELRVQR